MKRERRRGREGPVRQRADGDPEGVAGFQAGLAPGHQAGVSNAREQANPRSKPKVRRARWPCLRTQARSDPCALGGEQCQRQPPTHLNVEPPVLEVEDPRHQLGAVGRCPHELPELKGQPARPGEPPGRRDVDDCPADERGRVHAGPDVLGDHAVARNDRGPPAQKPLAGSQPFARDHLPNP